MIPAILNFNKYDFIVLENLIKYRELIWLIKCMQWMGKKQPFFHGIFPASKSVLTKL